MDPVVGGRIDIEFLGGASEIGASCALVTVGSTRVLVDCGVRFEPDNPLPDLSRLGDVRIDAVLVTHAHSDHTGGLPVLAGTRVYATGPTIELTAILLRDALKLMERPLYTALQMQRTLETMVPVALGQSVKVGEVEATFLPASHILGASMIHLKTEAGSVLFTGDFSVSSQLTVPALTMPTVEADMVVCEATYGARLHEDRKVAERRLVAAVAEVLERGGKVLVPAFAVGRAQEVLLVLKRAIRNATLPAVDVWVDGMVKAVCGVYGRWDRYVSRHLAHEIRHADHPFYDRHIHAVDSALERERVHEPGPAVIVASSGMLSGGASLFHAERLAGGQDNAILITGYQDEESPGRALLDLASGRGDGTLKLGGRVVQVKCKVHSYGLSAHADRMQVAAVISALRATTVVLVHGDGPSRESLAGAVMATDVVLPENGETVSRGYAARKPVVRRSVQISTDEARRLLGAPGGAPLKARELADVWYGPGAGRGDVEELVERMVQLGVARRDDAHPQLVHVLGPSESDTMADEARLEAELKSENPKGKLLELCMRMGIEAPDVDVQPDAQMHAASMSMTVGDETLEVGPCRAAAKKTAEQLACRELLARLEDRFGGDELCEVDDESAAALKRANPKGRLLEWCTSRALDGPRIDSRAVVGGYASRALLEARAASRWYRATSRKVGEQAACDELLSMVTASDGVPVAAVPTPAPTPSAQPARRDARMLLNELRQQATIADFNYEFEQAGGPAHAPVFQVTGHASLLGGRTVSTEPVDGRSKKEAQAQAAEALVKLLEIEGLL